MMIVAPGNRGDTVIGAVGFDRTMVAIARSAGTRRANTRDVDCRRVHAGSVGTEPAGAWRATGGLSIPRMRAVHISR
jgi:hypothetical protein